MFEHFTTEHVDVDQASLLVRHGGSGTPVLLLHGHPRTGATWHRVAPRLVEAGHTVVVPDLRGYGRSIGPTPRADHGTHSKRAMAQDMAQLMTSLGHDTFAVVGHDRGSYVRMRLGLDHPGRVDRIVLVDCLPISEHLQRTDTHFATAWWHWFFFAQPDLPERLIGADPQAFYRADPDAMGHENHAELMAAIERPGVVRAMLEDYRAGLTVDRAHEEADRRAGRRLTMPLLVLWALRDDLHLLHGDPLDIWPAWADDVRGHGIDCGHHVAEEAPHRLVEELVQFLR